VQRFASDGSKLGAQLQVNSFTIGDQRDPSLAVAADGTTLIVWEDTSGEDGDANGIFAQRFGSAGDALGSEFQVNTYTTGTQGLPKVAVDSTGGFEVVWSSCDGQDGSGCGVFGQRYSSGGAADGSEFQINSYTTGSQYATGVAADAYDPELARRLLVEAGGGPVHITLKTSTVEVRRRIGEVLAAMLAAVGIEAEIRPLEWATLYGDVRRGAFDVFALAWVGIEEPDRPALQVDELRQQPADHGNLGGDGVVDERTLVQVTALRPASTPQYARPAVSP
jgi:hypothetical protein